MGDIVGTAMFAPLIFPFEPWRIKHNHHHAHTNKLVEDTAWHPVMPNDMEKWTPVKAAIYKFILGSPLKCFASIGHWAIWHFDLISVSPWWALPFAWLLAGTAFTGFFTVGHDAGHRA